MKVTYFNDGGHGWYSVKREKLKTMGILEKVSSFSYQKGRSVYLEEDWDAGLFFNNLTEEEKQSIKVVNSCSNRSPVRGYSRFSFTFDDA